MQFNLANRKISIIAFLPLNQLEKLEQNDNQILKWIQFEILTVDPHSVASPENGSLPLSSGPLNVNSVFR